MLDGIIPIDRLLKKTGELGMKALAITDHGNLFGLLDFQEEAKKNAIHPILGCEFYLAEGSMKVRNPKDETFHLIALAETNEGYSNLCKLASMAYLDGFYYKPRIDKELLAEHSRGLILSSACLQGEIAWHLRNGRKEQARAAAMSYIDIAGRDNFFIELMDHGIEPQKQVNRALTELAKEMQLPLIATNDVHFLEREDYEASQIAICIGTADKFSNPNRRALLDNDNFYLKSADEMNAIFGEIPESLANTVRIAERCQGVIETTEDHPKGQKYLIPAYTAPDGRSENEYLRALCEEGIRKRYEEITPEIQKRLEYELSVIEQMGFSGYFLIVWDLVDYAKRHSIPVGPGRGSAAGSIVSYSLGITSIDPLTFDLFFERFLNPSRITMPDIDMDFCVEKREQIISYIREKYGTAQVAQIVTYQYLKSKAVIKDVARVLNFEFAESNEMTSLVSRMAGNLEEAFKLEPKLQEFRAKGGNYETLFRNAFKLEDVIRGTGKHAAGVVISSKPLIDIIPLHKDTKSDQVITQYDGPHLEKVGLLKMDLLGLQNLTTIEECLRLIQENRGIKIDLEKIPYDDKATYALLQKGQSLGIFQLDSPGMQQLLRTMKPDVFNEIIALNALHRPGPLKKGMHTHFCDRKFGRERVEYLLPVLENILKDTHGIIIYQEQVMQISQVVGGFSMAEADELRKAMGKKQKHTITQMRKQFLAGAKERGFDKRKAEELYELMAQFAEYGFNKSHSAAYAVISYQTAWLKANYPLEYMAALLTSQRTDTDKLEVYIHETQNMGIPLLPPDINHSAVNFAVEKNAIRYGLSAIKGIGEIAAQTIVHTRARHPFFRDLEDFCAASELRSANKRVLEALIKAGAFASTGKPRKALFESMEGAIEKGNMQKGDTASGQHTFFDTFADETAPIAKESPRREAETDWPEDMLLTYEKEFLGAYITRHPLARYKHTWKRLGLVSSRKHTGLALKASARIGGMLRSLQDKQTKNAQNYAVLDFEDFDGKYTIFLFSPTYDLFRSLLAVGRAYIMHIFVTRQKDRGDLRLTIQNIGLFDDLLERDLHITLSPETDNVELDAIQKLLLAEEYRGDSGIFFHIDAADKETVIRALLRVKPTEKLISRLQKFPSIAEVSVE
jgi:DNA polymerase-3 subunit alpha